MKIKHILTLFLLGAFLFILGTLFKIMHWQGAASLVTLGTILKGVAIISGIFKIFSTNKFQDFLNA